MTRAIAQELRRLYEVEATIVRPGVDTRNMRKSVLSGSRLRILSISRLEASKRLHWVLSSLAALGARSAAFGPGGDWRFDIVGDGTQRPELEKLSSDLGLADRVRFHGRLDDDAVQRLTFESNLFIMPAAQGYGLPALESLVRGVPVIAHRDSGVSEILQSTPWVRLVSAPDGSDLGDAIAEMSAAISRGALRDYPVPMIPSETDWAAEISRICRWSGDA
jgi:glycosyltransferase involved in cell wall biosynthesis